MNKTALYALLLALIVPIICYFIVKGASETAIDMPGKYIPDSVITTVKDGKLYTDTIWHQVPETDTFYNQLGERVTLADLEDKILVIDFFFTRCPTICPALTSNMKHLVESINNSQRVGDKTPDFVYFLSLSIDPERDSVKQLKKWADRFQIDPDRWWLLTGDKKTIYDLTIQEMKLGLVDGDGVDSNFIHTEKFVLLDGKRKIRGYYNGLEQASINKLSRDIVMLSLEKDRSKKSFFDGKLEIMAISFLLALVLAGLLYIILRKKTTK